MDIKKSVALRKTKKQTTQIITQKDCFTSLLFIL